MGKLNETKQIQQEVLNYPACREDTIGLHKPPAGRGSRLSLKIRESHWPAQFVATRLNAHWTKLTAGADITTRGVQKSPCHAPSSQRPLDLAKKASPVIISTVSSSCSSGSSFASSRGFSSFSSSQGFYSFASSRGFSSFTNNRGFSSFANCSCSFTDG